METEKVVKRELKAAENRLIVVSTCLGLCSYMAYSVCVCVLDSFPTRCRCAVDSFISAGSGLLRGGERREEMREERRICNDFGVYMGCSIHIHLSYYGAEPKD